jgi:hypothetical protein
MPLLFNSSSSSSAASVREEVFCEELDVFSQGDLPLSQDGLQFLVIILT